MSTLQRCRMEAVDQEINCPLIADSAKAPRAAPYQVAAATAIFKPGVGSALMTEIMVESNFVEVASLTCKRKLTIAHEREAERVGFFREKSARVGLRICQRPLIG